MAPWVQEALAEIQPDQAALNIVWLAQINRQFQLGESLRETAQRRWWDVLAFRLALELEANLAKPEEIA